MRVCFLLGSAGISGGAVVVLQHALHLSLSGHEVTVGVQQAPEPGAAAWHPALQQLRVRGVDELRGETFDVVVATWWRSVHDLPKLDGRVCCYFVQSVESRFYPGDPALRALVDATYALPLPMITEAAWIQEHLGSRGRSAHLVRNGIDKDVFRRDGPAAQPRRPGHLRVLVEGPVGAAFKNVPRTVRACSLAGADELWLLTVSPLRGYPHTDRVFSRLPIADTAAVYRSCDVLVKLSYVEGMFGPPLEMFHCGGTAVVYAVSGHDEYMRDGVNSLVLPVGDERSVVSAVRRLADDPDLLADLKTGALATAERWPSWAASSTAFEQALVTIAEAGGPSTQELRGLLGEASLLEDGRPALRRDRLVRRLRSSAVGSSAIATRAQYLHAVRSTRPDEAAARYAVAEER